MTDQKRALTPLPETDDFIEDALPLEPARAAQYLLYAIASLVAFTLVWASVAKLDRVTRGQGWVVTSNHLQEVQYLEGGIVKEILVSSGQKVEAGELLVKLDPTQMSVDFDKGQDEVNQLAARIARLEAEATLEPLNFPVGLSRNAPTIVSAETDLYEARMAELTSSSQIEQSKLDQQEGALADAEVALATAKEAFDFANQELTLVKSLVEKGIEPRVELLRAQQREAAARGEMQRAEITVSRAAFEKDGAQSALDRLRNTYRAEARAELNAARAELDGLRGELPALRDKVTRTELRAPVAGVVNRVLVSTVGGVVAPGETVVEIVPSEDSLLVEARIKPADIGFLTIGQTAKVSITAFDSALYGSLDGQIETISPDAIEDDKTGERYYNIRVRTSTDAFTGRGRQLRIMSGMAADVSILNGKRTVLAYVARPVSHLSDRALRD